MKRRYLGAAVYAEIEPDGCLVLTTSDGTREPTNRIIIEREVWDALALYMERWAKDAGHDPTGA